MAFKTDSSFLRFLTMGAVGVRETARFLREQGLEPIELERYSSSNKIWTTKVKRLRLPDLLCVRTGVRVEVRAKSTLNVRMSDAPSNPERRWDVGLRDTDLVAFIVCAQGDGGLQAKGSPVLCAVGDMRASVGSTTLGPPKSPAEGSERDRTWPVTTPGHDGQVLEVSPTRIKTRLASGRKQTYALKGKTPYVVAGDRFEGGVCILAGVLPRLASPGDVSGRVWDPILALESEADVDRYSAAKALPHVANADRQRGRLLELARREPDGRVALELAASAARLGSEDGLDFIAAFVREEERGDLRMEGVLILGELGSGAAAALLHEVATGSGFDGDELRQAAAWGLGKSGCRSYGRLVELLEDGDDAVVLHAIAAFGGDTPAEVVRALVTQLLSGSPRARAAASEALRGVGSDEALRQLVTAARRGATPDPWVLATLGRLPAGRVREALRGNPLLPHLEPLLLLTPAENWLAGAERVADLRFLEGQDL